MGIHEENSFKAQQIWLFGRPLGATARCHTLQKAVVGTIFPSQIVCRYLEPFTSNRASKLTILNKSLNSRIWNYCGYFWGVIAHAIHLKKDLLTPYICLSDNMRLACTVFSCQWSVDATIALLFDAVSMFKPLALSQITSAARNVKYLKQKCFVVYHPKPKFMPMSDIILTFLGLTSVLATAVPLSPACTYVQLFTI